MLALLLPLAETNNTHDGGPLTLIFPLILVFIVAGLWAASLRRRRHDR